MLMPRVVVVAVAVGEAVGEVAEEEEVVATTGEVGRDWAKAMVVASVVVNVGVTMRRAASCAFVPATADGDAERFDHSYAYARNVHGHNRRWGRKSASHGYQTSRFEDRTQ
jgi:hypothetical protein